MVTKQKTKKLKTNIVILIHNKNVKIANIFLENLSKFSKQNNKKTKNTKKNTWKLSSERFQSKPIHYKYNNVIYIL